MRCSILLSLACVSAIVGCAASALAQPKPFTAEYKLYTATATDHVYTMGAQRFAELVKERTGGRIKVASFPSGQLAKGEREALEGLQQGTIDLYVGSTGPVGNFAPAFPVLDIPFLFRDFAHVDKVLDGEIGRSILAELDRAELKGFAFWENGFRNLTNSKLAVKLPADVKDIKLRTMENKVSELFGWILAAERVPARLAETMLTLSGSAWVVLLLVNVLLFVLGIWLEPASLLIVLVSVLAPLAAKVGIDPIHFGTVVVMNAVIGLITPPVGASLFVVCSVSRVSFQELSRAVWPFVAVAVLILLLVTYVPPLST